VLSISLLSLSPSLALSVSSPSLIAFSFARRVEVARTNRSQRT